MTAVDSARRSPALYLLLLPAALLLSVLLWGLVDLVWKSFHSFDPFLYVEGGFTLANYAELFSSELVQTVLVRTLVMSAVVSLLSLVLAVPFAYVVVSTASRALRLLLITAAFVPILTGDITRTFAWLIILSRHGLVASAGTALGVDVPDLLGGPVAVGMGSLQVMFPLAVLLIVPAFQRVRPEYEEAATTLGARPWRRWWFVILPLLRPGLAAAAAVTFTVGVAEFASPALLGQGRFDYISNLIQGVVLSRDNVYLGSALGVLLLVIVLVVIVALTLLGRPRRRWIS